MTMIDERSREQESKAAQIAERHGLVVRAQNLEMYVLCPNCSRMYDVMENLPQRCLRCECPMDSKRAVAFSDAQAAGESWTAPQVGRPRKSMGGDEDDESN
jgi:hypothetical protein